MKFFKSNRADKQKYKPLDKNIIESYNKVRSPDKRKYLCHAPFKSMNFFHTGDVLACWYNKQFPLGHYPEDSVHDIWFSNRAKNLRAYILHNDLSYGCADCKKNFINKNFYAAGAWRYDFLSENKSKYPVSIDFQISNKCNLQCIMCNGEYSANVRFNRENRGIYKNPYDDNFFKQIEPFIPHLKEASFSGGEPFFASEFFTIWDLIKKINPQINLSLTTNGNLLDEKIRNYIEEMPFNINVSLDGITEETYNKIRINGNLGTVLKNIDFFNDYTKRKGTYFGIKICPMRQNWHELPEIAQYLNHKDISFLYNTVFFPPYCSLWNLPSGKLQEISSFLGKFHLQGNSHAQKENSARYNSFVKQIDFWKKEAVERENKGLEKMSILQLSEVFIENVNNYFADKMIHLNEDFPYNVDKIKLIVERLIKDAPCKKIALAGMLFYASAPVERLLAELEIRDYEMTYDRFVQMGLDEF